eukprot:1691600-Rhodomonas_salina.3
MLLWLRTTVQKGLFLCELAGAKSGLLSTSTQYQSNSTGTTSPGSLLILAVHGSRPCRHGALKQPTVRGR